MNKPVTEHKAETDAVATVRALINDPERTKPDFIGEPGIDKTLSVVLRLTQEISVLRDRLDTHEALAEKSGLYGQDDIDNFKPEPERIKQRAENRMKLIESIMHDLR